MSVNEKYPERTLPPQKLDLKVELGEENLEMVWNFKNVMVGVTFSARIEGVTWAYRCSYVATHKEVLQELFSKKDNCDKT